MALRFDLSGLSHRGAPPPSATCTACVNDDLFSVTTPSVSASSVHAPSGAGAGAGGGLTFSLGLSRAAAPLQLVHRAAAPVLQRIGIGASADEEKKERRGDSIENDQYSVAPGKNVCFAVLFKNDTGRKHPGSLLGDYGHAERLSAWVHLVAGVGFLIYCIVRPLAITTEHTMAETLTTVAAGGVAFAFVSSTIYHSTAPSKTLTVWTRQLDFVGIYSARALGSLADFAIATRSFQNVNILSVLDGPLACVLVGIFFISRRALLDTDATWSTYLGGCTLNFGLMRRGHLDLDHTGARQATSFLLAISYFTTVPSLYSNFGSTDATTVFVLELACLLLLVIGMVVDNVWVFPDDALAAGTGPKFLVCKSCGCIGTAHSIWHVLSVIAAVKGAGSREFALTLQR